MAKELLPYQPPGPTLITIGVFDGVHLGHQHLLRHLIEEADKRSLTPCVLTFKNHPLTVLSPGTSIAYISTNEEKEALLKNVGIALVVNIPFTHELSLLTARQFLMALQQGLKAKGLVVGPDFVMGHNREGDFPTLKKLGIALGLTVDMVAPHKIGSQVVSSTSIRQALAEGDLKRVETFLGRPFAISGEVVRGFQRGRDLGFPTANISVRADRALPRDGIYATKVRFDGSSYPSATSIGVRPTFGSGGQRAVEAYIMDFHEDLYGKIIEIEMVERMRDELRFNNTEDLKAQMAKDVERARALLGSK